jgi:cell division septation protein DedD
VYWYPDTSSGQTANICKYDNDYPEYMLEWQTTFLFQDACSCCDEHVCSDVNSGNYPELQDALAVCDMTGVSATMPTMPVTDPVVVMTEDPTNSPTSRPTTSSPTTSSPTTCTDCHWYPDTGTGITDKICKYGNDYPPFMVQYEAMFLFNDACACCAEHDCGDSSNGDFPELEVALTSCGSGAAAIGTSEPTAPNPTTSAPTTANPTTSAPTTANPTANPTTRSPTKNPTTSPSMNPTTSSPTPRATGTNGKYYYAYPDVLNGNSKCLWGTDYPDFMELEANKPDWLFDSIEECCAVKTCTAAPTSSPTISEYWYPDIYSMTPKCIKGSNYEPWMENERYGIDLIGTTVSFLFTTYDLCCAAHPCDDGTTETDGTESPPPSDVVTYIDEDFEAGNSNALPWTFSGAANWSVSTSRSVTPGKHSLRSGDLNGIGGKSTVVSIKVDSSLGAYLMFDYYVGISATFDRFEFRVDGDLKHMDKSPSGEWERYLQNLSPGPHTISFHVITYNPIPSFDRSNDLEEFGDGFVYLDNIEFQASTRR